MRQTRLALNKDMTRVQRVFLATGNCCDRAYLDAEHPGLTSRAPTTTPGQRCLRHFPIRPAADGSIYIVDPLGNLMMRHAPTRRRRRICWRICASS